MCGRYALQHTPAQLQEWYEVFSVPPYASRYNIAPGSRIVVIRGTADGHAQREASLMRWGFIPSWAKDPAAMPMLNNARAETVAEKPMFRQAFRRRRCLIPASGFYEWKAVPGQRSKQPFYISITDGAPMSFAGLWESARTADGEQVDTCAILTTDANAVLRPIHHRMPVLLERAHWDLWLGAEPATEDALMQLLRPFDADRMQVWGVSHAVNKVANDNPTLVQPIA